MNLVTPLFHIASLYDTVNKIILKKKTLNLRKTKTDEGERMTFPENVKSWYVKYLSN